MAAFEVKKAGIERRYADWMGEKDAAPAQAAAAAKPANAFGENDVGIALIKQSLKQIDDFADFKASDLRREPLGEKEDPFQPRESDPFDRSRGKAGERGGDSSAKADDGRFGDAGWRDRLHDLAKPAASRSYGWASRAEEPPRVLDLKG